MSQPSFGTRPVGSAVQPCPEPEKPKPVHWVEIRLIGEDSLPVPDVEYSIILPTGEEVRGYLNREGRARVESILSAGDCQVTFPALDLDAWEPA